MRYSKAAYARAEKIIAEENKNAPPGHIWNGSKFIPVNDVFVDPPKNLKDIMIFVK